MIYLRIIYFAYDISKWRKTFKYYLLLVLFTGATAAVVFGIVINPLTCMYASL